MRKRSLCTAVLFAILNLSVTAGVQAQQIIPAPYAPGSAPTTWALGQQPRPDFSGTWDLEPNTPVDHNSGSVTGGSWLRIDQDANEIRITRIYGRQSVTNPPVLLKVHLDGSEQANPYYGVHRPGLTGAIRSRASWEKDRLVIMTMHVMTDATRKTSTTVQIVETLSLDGRQLVIQRAVKSGAQPLRTERWLKR